MINLTSISVVAILMSFFPLTQVLAQPVAPVELPPVSNCRLDSDRQPTVPIKMNSIVVFPGTVKTILVEKEVFLCQHQMQSTPLILDVSTYTETIENLGTNFTAKNSFEVVTCAKKLDGNILACVTKEPPALLPSLQCNEFIQSSSNLPIEMNTVITNGIVKTIEAEKEIFNCVLPSNNSTVFKEVTLFTEKFESFDGPVLYDKRTSFTFSTCIKNVANASLIGCRMQTLISI
jgi:hypothetical protein